MYEYLDDDGKLRQKYSNKRVNAKKENIEFNLSFDEYKELMARGGYKSSDLGFTGNNIVLARYGDNGGYTVDNCRFITHIENVRERKITDKSRMSSSHNITEYNKSRKGIKFTKERLEKLHNSAYLKKRREQREIREKNKKIDKNNSQYGTFWITNNIDNRKWRPELGDLPDGYHKGRVV